MMQSPHTHTRTHTHTDHNRTHPHAFHISVFRPAPRESETNERRPQALLR